jgi:hypothetical protein
MTAICRAMRRVWPRRLGGLYEIFYEPADNVSYDRCSRQYATVLNVYRSCLERSARRRWAARIGVATTRGLGRHSPSGNCSPRRR